MHRFWSRSGRMIESKRNGKEGCPVIIKKLKIDDLEDIGHLELSFDSRVVSLEMPEADTVLKAVAVILRSVRMEDFAEDLCIKPGTSISAEIDINGAGFFVTARGSPEKGSFEYEVLDGSGNHRYDFYEMIHVCEEEDRLSCFQYDEKEPYSRRLKQYKETEKYYPEGVFSEITDGIGCTRTFRALLNGFIKEFEPCILSEQSDRKVILNCDGVFVPFSLESSERAVELNKEEKIRFEMLCFRKLNAFWNTVEDVRNCNHVVWPLFVIG